MATHTIHTVNGIDMEALQKTVDAVRENPGLGRSRFRVHNRWVEGNQNRSTDYDYYAAGGEQHHHETFELHADEPELLAGHDQAPNPVEHLLHALASCVTTSLVAHAAVRGIHIEEVESQVEGDIDLRGYLGLDSSVPKGYTNIRIHFRVKSDEQNVERLKRLAMFSPVFNTLTHGAPVDIEIELK